MPRNNRPETPRTGRFAHATNGPQGGPPTRRATNHSGGRFEVRIIGGEWRGRKLNFPQAKGLRPTPDRVRETVFNWLQFELVGRRCLDLFAGSGAFGLEALSRGAAHATFVEKDADAASVIRDWLQKLGCDRGHVVHDDAFAWLVQLGCRVPYDVAFIDPPYGANLLARTVQELERSGCLAPDAWIYLEDAAERGEPVMPPGWVLKRSKRAGVVGYHLARRVPGGRNRHTEIEAGENE